MPSRCAVAAWSIALVLLSGCTGSAKIKTVDPRVLKLFGGQENLAPVLKPVAVEAFRVRSRQLRPSEQPVAAENSIADWPILAGPIVVDPATRAELIAMLPNPNTYEWEALVACKIEPGVGLRFTDRAGATEILLCFTCGQIAVVRGGEIVGHTDFGNGGGQFLAIAKRLFPDDAEIQELGKP
jgi:hypothetical protein